jgi:hypothetical protein
MVRVGGGFMPFDEFYKNNAELEAEKMMRISPVKDESTCASSIKKKKKRKIKKSKAINRNSMIVKGNEGVNTQQSAPFSISEDEDEEEYNQTIPAHDSPLLKSGSAKVMM